MKHLLQTLEATLRGLFNDTKVYTSALIINLLVILVSYYVFLVPVQSIDLFNGLVADQGSTLWWFWGSVTALSLVMFYSTIVSLYLYDLNDLTERKRRSDGKDIHDRIINALPYVLGIMIYLIIFFGFNQDEVIRNSFGWYYLSSGLVLYGIIYGVRKKLDERAGYAFMISKDRRGWKSFSKIDKAITISAAVLIALTLLLALLISFREIKPVAIPQYFQTTTLLCAYLAGLSMLFSVIWGIINFEYAKISLAFVLIVCISVFSLFNNNHHIRQVEQSTLKKPNVEADFSNWIGEKLDTAIYNEEQKFPIYLIAAEGGGIRSLKWTALVIDKLFASNPQFKDHTYALSGVSGGSVGIVFQEAAMEQAAASYTEKLNATIDRDFLSPVTFGMLFPDITQSIIPFPIKAWDRSRWLEDAWHCAFREEFGTEVMNYSVSDYWNEMNPALPNVFLNSTAIETGQKVVVSNLELSDPYFKNVIGLDDEIAESQSGARGIPLKTAASLSARFPIVTSAGTASLPDKSINVVDGGYHDNTGLETLLQLLNLIVNTTDPSTLAKCQISLVFIKNSADVEHGQIESKSFLIDLSTPLLTLVNNWNDGTAAMLLNTKNLIESLNELGLSVDFTLFELDRSVFVDEQGNRVYDGSGKKVVLPLGWYLSEASSREISRQASALTDKSKFDPEKDQVAKTNFENFQTLISRVK